MRVPGNGQAAGQLSCALMLTSCQDDMQDLLSIAVQASCWLCCHQCGPLAHHTCDSVVHRSLQAGEGT